MLSRRSLLAAAFAGVIARHVAGAPPSTPRPKGLLVVAPERFRAALGAYLAHKRKQLPARFVSLEAALKEAGADDPERLKRCLYRAWRAGDVGYVLLVGDADMMPVRYMVLDRVTPAAFDYAFYPSDLYYADLAKPDGAFDDWNGHKDGFHAGYFGEVRGEKNKKDPINYDGIDYRPDVAVGRWPVSTEDEVRLVAAKTIRYEEGLLRGDKPGARRAVLFSVGGWVDSRPVMDGVADALGRAWSVDKRYYADKSRDDRTPAPDQAQLRRVLGEGAGLVCHAGHGSDDTWEQCFSRADLKGLGNADRLPILVSAGCSTARLATLPPYEAYVDVDGGEHRGSNAGEVFTAPPPSPAPYQKGSHNPTGLGEQLLRGGPDGAVAYIGCDTGSQPCALTLLTGFTRAVADATTQDTASPARLGDCWSRAVAHYYDAERLATLTPNDDWYPPSIFFQAMKFLLFGDPSLLLPAPKRP